MVLGITNRTENWKTAQSFSSLFGEHAVHLARRLGESLDTGVAEIQLELFWKGMRDYCSKEGEKLCPEAVAQRYNCLFPNLREHIQQYSGFQSLNDDNYEVSTQGQKANLVNNLYNTEIDIVMETPRHLYIGEAKYKSGFHAASKLVLVHQLIRQYVMAKILMDMAGFSKEVIPFVVVDYNRKQRQVKFMIWRKWMEDDHVLTWDQVGELTKP